MSILRMSVAVVILAAAFTGGGSAQGLSASGHVGTLGVGADVSLGLTDRLAVRVGANFQPWEPKREIDGIDFELDLPSPAWTGAVDLYLAGPFRLTGGVVAFGSTIEVRGDLAEDVEIGDATYSPQEIGTLTGAFDTRDVAPWFGIGLGRSGGSGVGFTLDLGVALQGEPVVTLSATGPVAADPVFEANLVREQQNIQEDAKMIRYYPMVSIGFTVGF